MISQTNNYISDKTVLRSVFDKNCSSGCYCFVANVVISKLNMRASAKSMEGSVTIA